MLRSALLKRLACLACVFVLFLTTLPAALAESDPEVSLFGDEVKQNLDAEDLAQWQQWEQEDANAATDAAGEEQAVTLDELDAEHAQIFDQLQDGDTATIAPSQLEDQAFFHRP